MNHVDLNALTLYMWYMPLFPIIKEKVSREAFSITFMKLRSFSEHHEQNLYWVGGNDQHGRRGIGNKPESLHLYYLFFTCSYQGGWGKLGLRVLRCRLWRRFPIIWRAYPGLCSAQLKSHFDLNFTFYVFAPCLPSQACRIQWLKR